MVHGIDGLQGAGSSGSGDGGAYFVFHEARVQVADDGRSFEECLHVGGYIGGIGRGAQKHTVCFFHFFEDFAEAVVLMDAVSSSCACPARFARLYDGPGELDELGLDAFLLKGFEDFPHHDCCVSVLSCACTDAQYFHHAISFSHSRSVEMPALSARLSRLLISSPVRWMSAIFAASST